MSETEHGRLDLCGTEHSKCNYLMTLGFKRLNNAVAVHAADATVIIIITLHVQHCVVGLYDWQSRRTV